MLRAQQPPQQKLTVADEVVQTRQSSKTIMGRLISWLNLHIGGDAQKAADQTAFRTELIDRYGEPLGERAYNHACKACGYTDGRSHSLTSKQVLAAEDYATRRQKDKEYLVTPDQLAQKNASLEAKASVAETVKVRPDRSTTYFTVQSNDERRVTNEQIRQTGADTLDSICEQVAQKYGSNIADATKAKLQSSKAFETIHSQVEPEEQNDATQVVTSVNAFIDKIWSEAHCGFIDTLPGAAAKKFKKLDLDLEDFTKNETPQTQLNEISERYGLKKDSVYATSSAYTDESNEQILDHRYELAIEALSLAIDKVYSQSQENGGQVNVTRKTFSTVLKEATVGGIRDEALFTKDHLEDLARESAALGVVKSEAAEEPVKSILKSAEPSAEPARKKTVTWG